MAQYDVHLQKAGMFWALAQRKRSSDAAPFVCINLAMYAIGHYVEALLARLSRHPASPPRGVPHSDREAMLRKFLVTRDIVEVKWADTYSELSGRRDTFIDGGIPDRRAAEEYMELAIPLVAYLEARLSMKQPAS